MTTTSHTQLVRLLVESSQIVVFTGAGISTGAGIPDYRGPQGLWKTRPETSLQDCAADPEVLATYWRLKAEDWERARLAEPTPAHRALVTLDQLGKLRCVITQNIDGLHARSGLPPARLVELHGSLDRIACIGCGYDAAASEYYPAFARTGEVPACPDCGHWLKPGVIQFGEGLREESLVRAQDAMWDTDLVLALGSTLAVQPAASFPLMAARQGVPYVIINQGPTAHDGLPHVHLRLESDLQAALPVLIGDVAAMYG